MEMAPRIKDPKNPTLREKETLFKFYRQGLDKDHREWRTYYYQLKVSRRINGTFSEYLNRIADEMVCAHIAALVKAETQE